jgi:hypothetical protein
VNELAEFVGWEWQGLEMKRNPERPSDADFAMWMVERWEIMNLQLSVLAVTFMGFLGVELALISQADPKSSLFSRVQN